MKNKKFVCIILVPCFAMIFIFAVFPLFYGLGISLFDYNAVRAENPFIGIANYKRLFQDEAFLKAFKNTIVFSLVAVGSNIVVTLFLAQIITILPSKKWKTLFRTILFIPCIAPMVGTALVWKDGILYRDGGMMNTFLGWFGIEPVNWFGSTFTLMFAIIVFTLWADIGYNVVLFCAGLEGIPKEFDEAAAIDGAGPIQRFFKIRLPLMSRTFAFVFIMTMVNYFQMFAQFKVLSSSIGEIEYGSVLTSYIYKQSFQKYNMGYASAVAMVLFIMILIVAMIQNRMLQTDWGYE